MSARKIEVNITWFGVGFGLVAGAWTAWRILVWFDWLLPAALRP